MAKKAKATVDYFPHTTEHGATLFILQERWGNDGFAVWFKVLERLGASDGHYIDCRNPGTWLHLVAYSRVDESTLNEILDLLAELGKIDQELWQKRVVFCQRFIDGITDAYRRRINSLPSREKVIAVTKALCAVNMPSDCRENGEPDSILRERERERERERKEEPLQVSEVAALYQKYAGVNVVNGGQVVVIQDLIKNFTRETITEAFQAAACANISTPAFLNWSKSRMERQGDIRADDTDAMIERLNAGLT